jgi:divalent metal cation (Fe/Co/Zn/Cd) transporter
MQGFLRLTQLLAMVVWAGGLIFFAFVLAPTAFHTLPTAHLAGGIVGACLRVFDLVALFCGGLFLAVTALMFRAAPMRIRGRYEMEFLLAGVMVLGTAYIHYNILPSMDRDQAQAGGDVALVASDNPAKLHFDKLHARSERVDGGILIVSLFVLFLMSREQLPIAD